MFRCILKFSFKSPLIYLLLFTSVLLAKERGKEDLNISFLAPVHFGKMTSGFSFKRKHPVLNTYLPHMGVDLAVDYGSPIFSVTSGQIIRVGSSAVYGNFLIISHGFGYESLYAHLSQASGSLTVGSMVAAGSIVGYVGCTGYCTGPHLHFELRKNGKSFDPLKVIDLKTSSRTGG